MAEGLRWRKWYNPETMKRIRVKFTDYYGMPPERIPFYGILRKFYDVELSDDPDYVIDGGLGSDHLRYDCVKIVCVGESYVPDFNQFDYAIGFDHLEFGDRYLRHPLFALYPQFGSLACRPVPDPAKLLNRGVCSCVVSNDDGDPMRVEFFRRLSRYKPVASGGKLLNNVGGCVPDKMAFISNYKFNIAFENSAVPGYTTEKVMETLAAGSVPIYYGNPRLEEDFHPDCLVRVAGRADVERAVEEIVALDRDDDAYLRKCAAEPLVHSVGWYGERLERFVRHVFDQPLEEARRLNAYGYQTNIRRRAIKAESLYLWTHPGKLIRRWRGK